VALCEDVYIPAQRLTMSESTTISIRLDAAVKARLDHLADATHRSKSFLAAEAIRAFVELNEWQINEFQTALGEANAGDFAKTSEVGKVLGKWRKPRSQW
jgi:RHH-type transcriptional regulator, rel operon repressor / antitoxin RelB